MRYEEAQALQFGDKVHMSPAGYEAGLNGRAIECDGEFYRHDMRVDKVLIKRRGHAGANWYHRRYWFVGPLPVVKRGIVLIKREK